MNRARLRDHKTVRHILPLAIAARTAATSWQQENGFGRHSKARSRLARRAVASSTRRMVEAINGEIIEAPVYTRASLAPGAGLSGPAAIVEDGTTTIVPTGFTAHIAHGGEIIIEGGFA